MIWSSFRLVLLCLALFCSSSFAANTWESTPETVATGANLYAPQIVADYSGNSHAIWYGGSGSSYSVYYNYRPYGGSWGTPVTLVSALSSAPTISIVADLTTHPTAYVGWLSGGSLSATTIPYPYTSRTTPTTIDNSGHVQSFSMAYNQQNYMSRDPLPGAIVVYEYYAAALLSGVYYAVSTGGAWSSSSYIVHDPAGGTRYKNPQVALGGAGSTMTEAQGQAFALWIQGSGSDYNAYASFTLTPYTDITSMSWEMPFALNSTTNKADSNIAPTITNPANRSGSQDTVIFGAWVEEPTMGSYTIYGATIGLSPSAITVASGLTTEPTIQAAENFIDVLGVVATAGPTNFNVYTSLDPSDMSPTFSTQPFTGMSIQGTPVLSYDQNSNGIVIWNDNSSINAATYDFSMTTWSQGAVTSETPSITPWVSAFGYYPYFGTGQQGIAIWAYTDSIKSATLNYSAPHPPSGSLKRSFHRPNNRRAGPPPPG